MLNYWQMVALLDGMVAAALLGREGVSIEFAITFTAALVFALFGSKV